MRTIPTLFFLFLSFIANAQLVFKNTTIEKSNISKFIVSQVETQLFKTINNKETLLAKWNKTPININSKEGQNQFKMTVIREEIEAKITYEIHYSLYRKTNKHVGFIKTTYVYFDKKPTRITEDYFTI